MMGCLWFYFTGVWDRYNCHGFFSIWSGFVRVSVALFAVHVKSWVIELIVFMTCMCRASQQCIWLQCFMSTVGNILWLQGLWVRCGVYSSWVFTHHVTSVFNPWADFMERYFQRSQRAMVFVTFWGGLFRAVTQPRWDTLIHHRWVSLIKCCGKPDCRDVLNEQNIITDWLIGWNWLGRQGFLHWWRWRRRGSEKSGDGSFVRWKPSWCVVTFVQEGFQFSLCNKGGKWVGNSLAVFKFLECASYIVSNLIFSNLKKKNQC